MYLLITKYKSTWINPFIDAALVKPLLIKRMSEPSIPKSKSTSWIFALSIKYGKSKLSELYPTIMSTLFSFTISANDCIISFSDDTWFTKSSLSWELVLVDITWLIPKLLATPIMIISSSAESGIPWGFLTSKSKLSILNSFELSSTLSNGSSNFIISTSFFSLSRDKKESNFSPETLTLVIGITSLSIRYLL